MQTTIRENFTILDTKRITSENMNNVPNNHFATTPSLSGGDALIRIERPIRTSHFGRASVPNNDAASNMELRARFNSSFKKVFVKNATLIPLGLFSYHSFDCWFNTVPVFSKTFSVSTRVGDDRGSRYRFTYQLCSRSNAVSVNGEYGTKEKQCYDIVCKIWNSMNVVVQMEDLGLGQQSSSESSQAHNTIMTAETTVDSAGDVVPDPVVLSKLCNTEETYSFPQITDRFQLFDSFEVSSGTKVDGLKKTYSLPSALYNSADVANMLPFRNMIYADLDLEIRVAVNAPQFGVGRLIISSFPDSYDDFGDDYAVVGSMLQREHVIIDLSANNQAIVRIPNQYKRTYVRCLHSGTSAKGIRTGEYAALQIELLSSYRVVSGQPTVVPVQVYYRFVKANFAGMSYSVPVTVQGDLIDTLVDVGTTLFPAAKPLEGVLKRAGNILNQDKPYNDNSVSVLPKPRLNFSAGKGVSDNVPLTLDHATTVTILDEHLNRSDPQTVLDIAGREGLELRGTWKHSDKHGAVLIDWPINPSALVSTKTKLGSVPCPLKYVCNMYEYWSGTIDVRLDFVANNFHTGSVLLECVFNRTTDNTNNAASTYTKMFDLGQGQKSVEFRIPYIYDTPWRRNNIIPDCFLLDNVQKVPRNDNFDLAQWASACYVEPQALAERCRAFFRVTVLNILNPIQNVSSEIEILMMMKAGPDFKVHSLMPQQLFKPYLSGTNGHKDNCTYGRFPAMKSCAASTADDPVLEKTQHVQVAKNWNKFEGIAKPYPLVMQDYTGKKVKKVVFQGDIVDPTDNFSSGIAYKTFHTTDLQINIKDILRRNVMILNDKVPALLSKEIENLISKDSAVTKGLVKHCYMIPCFAMNQFDSRKPFRQCNVSPHAALTTLFRHWRGSLRYVFVFKKVIDNPVYVSYMPVTGSNWVGPHKAYTTIQHVEGMDPSKPFSEEDGRITDQLYFAETGMATELCLTRINQTLAVAVPFDTNMNRCVISRRARIPSRKDAVCSREEIGNISGHLVVQCAEEIEFDLFYSVGDDFELSDFVGCAQYNQRVAALNADEWVQGHTDYASLKEDGFDTTHRDGGTNLSAKYPEDFRKLSSSREAKSYLQTNEVRYQMDSLIEFGKSSASSAALLGIAGLTGYSVAKNAGTIAKGVSSISDTAGKACESASELMASCGVYAKEAQEMIMAQAELLSKRFECVIPPNFSGPGVISIVIDVVQLIRSFNYINLAILVIRYITKLYDLKLEVVMRFQQKIIDSLKPLLGFLSFEQHSGEKSPVVSFFGVLVGIVGTCLGVSDLVCQKKCVDYAQAFKMRMTDMRGLGYFTTALNFVEYMFSALQSITKWIFGLVDPREQTKAFLVEKRPEIASLLDDIELVTNPANAIMMRKPKFKVKVWTTHIRSVNLKKELIKMNPSVGTNGLLNYCNQMIKFAAEKYTALTCAPVRYEPFVIGIVGPSNIGKSTVNMPMVCDLLNVAGYDCQGVNPVYTRTPGKKHWDGYQGGLAITYDDWMNLTDPEQVKEQIAELYELKSRSSFIPQMASLEDKGLSANPRIVTLLTNDAFPFNSVNSVTCHSEAVWRRRDVLIKCKSKHACGTRELSPEQTENFGHLLFSFTDPINQEMINDAAEWIGYEEMMVRLRVKFVEYDLREQENMKREIACLQKFTENESTLDDDPTDVLNYFFLKQKHDQLNMPNSYPSDLLATELNRVLDAIKDEDVPEPDGVETQGWIEDSIHWITGLFSTKKKEYACCSHCGQSTLVLLTRDEDEDLIAWSDDFSYEEKSVFRGSHQLCITCAGVGTSCLVCVGKSSKFMKLSRASRTKLASIRKYRKDLWVKLLHSWEELNPMDRYLIKSGVGAVAMTLTMQGLGYYMSRKLSQKATEDAKKAFTFQQGDEDEENDAHPVLFSVEEFDRALNLRSDNSFFTCPHKDMSILSCVYNAGHWVKKIKGIEVHIPFSKCLGKECCLDEEEGLATYREFVEEYCELIKLNVKSFAVSLLQSRSTGFEHEAYINMAPPCMRVTWVKCRAVDRFSKEVTLARVAMDDEIMSWTSKFPKWFTMSLKVLGIGLTITGVILGVSKLITMFSPKVEQVLSSGAMQTRHFLKNRARVVRPSKIASQSHAQLKESLIQKVLKNYVLIFVVSEGKTLHTMLCCGVYNKVAIMPRHYLRAMREVIATNTNVSFVLSPVTSSNIQVDYKFCEDDFIESATADLAIFRVPQTLNMFVNLRPYMAKNAEDLRVMAPQGYLLVGPTKKNSQAREVTLKIFGVKAEQEVSGFTAVDSLHYNFSQAGGCGSLAMRENHTRPIVAMHFAGTSMSTFFPEGYGVLLTQEMFDDLDDDGIIMAEEVRPLRPAEEAKIVFPEFVEVQSLGAHEKSVFMPVKSKILPSMVQGALGAVLTKPAFLSVQEKGYPWKDSPLMLGCSKHGLLTQNFTSAEVDEAMEALWDLKYSGMQPMICNPKRLTLKEAVGGLNHPGYEAIKLDTSMGYPYVFGDKTLKKHFIQIIRDEEGNVTNVLIDAKVVEEQRRIDGLRAVGVRPFLPYVDELKDERKKLDKRMKEGSTRVFCMSSIHSTIAVRSNFLHFAAAYTQGRITNLCHSVGISRDGPEWTRLVSHLSEISLENVVTMDYSNFGPGYNAMVNARGHEIMKRWTVKYVAGVNEAELDVLGVEHYNSDHIMNDLVYRQFSGGPSGDALTVVKNGLVNELYILLAWKALMGKWCEENGYSIYPAFYQLTRLVTYGDDLIMSVAEHIRERFNGVTIKNFFSSYGITATDALKTGEDVPYTTIHEASFLKSGFKPHPLHQGEWLAPLDETSITETANWIRQCANHEEATLQNCEASLREAYGHGEEYYNNWKSLINSALIKAGLKTIHITWKELDRNFFPHRYLSKSLQT